MPCRKQVSQKAYELLLWCVMLALKKSNCKSFFQFQELGIRFDGFGAKFALCQKAKTEEKQKYAQKIVFIT